MNFERASKMKLRFGTPCGSLTIEDLWDLPLTSSSGASLDLLAKDLDRQIKEGEGTSFVTQQTTASAFLELKFAIVKRVIKVRLDEIESKEQALANKARKDRILAIIEGKKDEALQESSVTELQEMLEKM